jgi:hypothetical protein
MRLKTGAKEGESCSRCLSRRLPDGGQGVQRKHYIYLPVRDGYFHRFSLFK